GRSVRGPAAGAAPPRRSAETWLARLPGGASTPQRRGDGALLALALDRELHLVARLLLGDDVAHVGGALHVLAVDADDDVARLQACGLGTAAGHDLADERTVVRGHAEAIEDRRLQVAEVDGAHAEER